MRHSLFNVHLQYLSLRPGLEPMALSIAIRTLALHLCDHAGSNLAHFHDSSSAVAFFAFFGLSVNDFSVDRQLDRLSIVQVLKRNFNGVVD